MQASNIQCSVRRLRKLYGEKQKRRILTHKQQPLVGDDLLVYFVSKIRQIIPFWTALFASKIILCVCYKQASKNTPFRTFETQFPGLKFSQILMYYTSKCVKFIQVSKFGATLISWACVVTFCNQILQSVQIQRETLLF